MVQFIHSKFPPTFTLMFSYVQIRMKRNTQELEEFSSNWISSLLTLVWVDQDANKQAIKIYRSNKTKHFFFHRHLSSVAYCRSKGWLGWDVSYLWSRLCHILLIYSVPNFYILSYTFICWYIPFLFTNFYSWKFEFQQFAWLVCSHSSIESWLCSAEHFQSYYVEEEFWRHPSRVKTF